MNRKHIIIPAALAIAMLTSCSVNGNGSSSVSNQTNTDSAKAPAAGISSATTEKTDRIVSGKLTPDMAFYEVSGPVKTIYTGRYNRVDFDREGNVISVNGVDVFSSDYPMRIVSCAQMIEIGGMSRNNKGQIIKENFVEGVTEYTWEDGRIASLKGISEGIGENAVFLYNDDLRLERVEINDYSLNGESDELIRRESFFTYTKDDSHGNWIERQSSNGYTEKRHIVYYGEEGLLPDGYTSYDLAFFEAAGPVKKITEKHRTLEFDKQGTCLKIDGLNPFENRPEEWSEDSDRIYYKKDNFGKITGMDTPYAIMEFTWAHGFVFMTKSWEEGGVIVETATEINYETGLPAFYYQSEGDVTGDQPVMSESTTNTVSAQKLDSHGNWTSRKVGENLQERTIEYW